MSSLDNFRGAGKVATPGILQVAPRPGGVSKTPGMSPILLFDIDGTLVRTGGAGKRAVETALIEHFGVREIRDEVPYSGRTDQAILRDVLRVHGVPDHDDNVRAFGDAYLDRLANCLTALGGETCPGIRELLGKVSHHPLGLLTGNVERGARIKLEHFDLWHHFRFGGYGDMHQDRDDVARAALRAVRQVFPAVSPADIWIIGDTPLDVQCARAIGAQAVAVATGWTSIEDLAATGADLVLETLADFSKLPAEWFS
jgi:phosphoglycolate phosphatase